MEHLHQVLHFWFGSAENDAAVSADKESLWFGKESETDRQIEQQFGSLIAEASSGALNAQIDSPQARLAVILLLDQFTRNIYRGKPECFASDPVALQLALEGLSRGEDRGLRGKGWERMTATKGLRT